MMLAGAGGQWPSGARQPFDWAAAAAVGTPRRQGLCSHFDPPPPFWGCPRRQGLCSHFDPPPPLLGVPQTAGVTESRPAPTFCPPPPPPEKPLMEALQAPR